MSTTGPMLVSRDKGYPRERSSVLLALQFPPLKANNGRPGGGGWSSPHYPLCCSLHFCSGWALASSWSPRSCCD
ncbi:hypothetical protein Taro_046595 [Colocasia esculenta]|uniref:Uncharacterized protein n=1 Tax=Colocasia esculenta TaxID=4460 RepID=A0A843WU60_COLES|nr:hypothetical protein [Colocasia esculenta]